MVVQEPNKFITPLQAVKLIRNLLNDKDFEIHDLARLAKHNDLNIYVEFLKPISVNVPSGIEGLFDLPDKANSEQEFEFKKIKERAVPNPVEKNIYLSNAVDYNLELSVDDALMKEGSFKYYSEVDPDQPLTMSYEAYSIEYCKDDNAWWLISLAELDNYIETMKTDSAKDLGNQDDSPPLEPNWVELSSGKVAIHLVHIWEFRWKSEKKDIPNVHLLLKTVRENSNKFKNYHAGINFLTHDPDNTKGWKDSKLSQSWKRVLKKYHHQK